MKKILSHRLSAKREEVQTTLSTSNYVGGTCVLQNCANAPVQALTILGKSAIKHAPSVEKPTPILSYGLHTKNYFDIKNIISNDGEISENDGDITVKLINSTATIVLMEYFSPEYATSCLSCEGIVKSGGISSLKIEIKQVEDKTNVITEDTADFIANKSHLFYSNGDTEHSEITIKLAGSAGGSVTLKKLMWEPGDRRTEYEFAGYKSVIRVSGKNLVQKEYVDENSYGNCEFSMPEENTYRLLSKAGVQNGSGEESGYAYLKGDKMNGIVYLHSGKKYTFTFSTRMIKNNDPNNPWGYIGLRKLESGTFSTWANFYGSGISSGNEDLYECCYYEDFMQFSHVISVSKNGFYAIVLRNCNNDVEFKDLQIEIGENDAPVYEKPYSRDYSIRMVDCLRAIGANRDSWDVLGYKHTAVIKPSLDGKRTVGITQESADHILATPVVYDSASANIVLFDGYNCIQFLSFVTPYNFKLSTLSKSV